jgi:hypothetical protein
MTTPTPTPWTQRTHNQPAGRGRYFIIKGKAYPSLLPGRAASQTVDAAPADREAFYNHPTIKLSEGDLDDIQGVDGAPLCFEHNAEDRVGTVTHSWIDSEKGRCLKIWGRIPLQHADGTPHARGHQILAGIKAGSIRGLSVGYSTPLNNDPVTGTKKLMSKTFDEISLVEKPFFQGCDLTVGVLASASSAPAPPSGNLGNKLASLDN